MGYEVDLALTGPEGTRWRGVHARPQCNLQKLFEALVLSPEADDLQQLLPAETRLTDVLSESLWVISMPESEHLREVVVKRIAASSRRWGASKARRAHLGAHRARAYGIATPRPLGFLERRRWPRTHDSYLVTERLRSPDVYRWWQDHLQTLRGSDEGAYRREKRRRLDQLGSLLADLHEARLFHGDLHIENLLVTDEGLALVDLESLRSSSRGAARKNLGRLDRDARRLLGLSRSDRLRVLRAYLRHQAAPGALTAYWSARLTASEDVSRPEPRSDEDTLPPPNPEL